MTGKTVNIPILEISEQERAEGKPTPESVDAGERLLREAGLVVIESVLPRDWIADLNVAMETVQSNEEEREDGENPMLKMPFMDPRIIDNPFAMSILKAAMGDKFFAYLPYAATQLVRVTKSSGFIEIRDNSSRNYRLHYLSQRLSSISRSLISQ